LGLPDLKKVRRGANRELLFFGWHELPNNSDVSDFETDGLRLSWTILKSKMGAFLNLEA
jgi:hypothetical protein